MIVTHSLPADTKERVARSTRSLTRFPRIGRELEGRWRGFRFVLGPWRWMLIIYVYEQPGDLVLVVSVQDGRSARGLGRVELMSAAAERGR